MGVKKNDRWKEIVNGSYKVTEKQSMLYKLKKEFNEKIDEAVEKVKKKYKYCPKCKEYYKDKAWDTEHKTEKREVCTYRDAGYGDADVYEDKICSVTYEICPIGHVIEKDVMW